VNAERTLALIPSTRHAPIDVRLAESETAIAVGMSGASPTDALHRTSLSLATGALPPANEFRREGVCR
jgi:hypothetical protein